MKFVNPLYYPLAVLVGAVVLVLGVRVARLPGLVMLPVAGAIATVGAAVLQSREPEQLGLNNPALEQELRQVQGQAQDLAAQAESLRAEATQLLTQGHQMELLGGVQYACDRVQELPTQIPQLAKRLQGSDSLLSVTDLQAQLQAVESRLSTSSGVAHQSQAQLADRLRRNMELAQQGQDARQAQVVSLSTQIADAAGVLQSLQNKLRIADLNNANDTEELRSLSEDLKQLHENVEMLLTR